MGKKYLVSLNGVNYVWDDSNVQKNDNGNLVFIYLDERANLCTIPAVRCDDIEQFDVISSFDLDTLDIDTNKMQSGGMGKHSILYKAIDQEGDVVILQENWSDFSGVLSTGKILDVMDLYKIAETHPSSQQWVINPSRPDES